MIKKIVLALLVILIAFFFYTFTAATLPVGDLAETTLPAATPPLEMSISAIDTGTIGSKAAFAYRGGSFFEDRVFSTSATLVHHPKGDLLIDAGFGKNVEAHVKALPAVARAGSVLHKGKPVAEQLDARTLAGVILTHAHWDHVSGLEDMKSVAVWVTAEEQAFIKEGFELTELIRGFGALAFHTLTFTGGAYLGYAKSLDVYGDGAIVIVPAPGHTPGSVNVFVTLPSGKRYLFIGDNAWQSEGVTIPAERPWLLRSVVDAEPARVREQLSHLAALHRRFPDLRILPAHDSRAFSQLPAYPKTLQ